MLPARSSCEERFFQKRQRIRELFSFNYSKNVFLFFKHYVLFDGSLSLPQTCHFNTSPPLKDHSFSLLSLPRRYVSFTQMGLFYTTPAPPHFHTLLFFGFLCFTRCGCDVSKRRICEEQTDLCGTDGFVWK